MCLERTFALVRIPLSYRLALQNVKCRRIAHASCKEKRGRYDGPQRFHDSPPFPRAHHVQVPDLLHLQHPLLGRHGQAVGRASAGPVPISFILWSFTGPQNGRLCQIPSAQRLKMDIPAPAADPRSPGVLKRRAKPRSRRSCQWGADGRVKGCAVRCPARSVAAPILAHVHRARRCLDRRPTEQRRDERN